VIQKAYIRKRRFAWKAGGFGLMPASRAMQERDGPISFPAVRGLKGETTNRRMESFREESE
jgi:hypothetical protein